MLQLRFAVRDHIHLQQQMLDFQQLLAVQLACCQHRLKSAPALALAKTVPPASRCKPAREWGSIAAAGSSHTLLVARVAANNAVWAKGTAGQLQTAPVGLSPSAQVGQLPAALNGLRLKHLSTAAAAAVLTLLSCVHQAAAQMQGCAVCTQIQSTL